MDWNQILSLLPALGAIKQGGPEFEAFMQGYQQADEQLTQRGQRQQGLDIERERYAAEDARQASEDQWRTDERRRVADERFRSAESDLAGVIPAETGMIAGSQSIGLPLTEAPGTFSPGIEGTTPADMTGTAGVEDFSDPTFALSDLIKKTAAQAGYPSLASRVATPSIGPMVSTRRRAAVEARIKALEKNPTMAEAMASNPDMELKEVAEVFGKPVSYRDVKQWLQETLPKPKSAPKSAPNYRADFVKVNGVKTAARWNPDAGQWEDLRGNVLPNVEEVPPPRNPPITITGATGATDARDIAEAIIAGDQPPVLTGLYRMAAPVRAELARQKYDLASAQSDWNAVQRRVATLNGPQQTRLRQAAETAYHSLDIIEELAGQWKGGQFPLLNRAQLAAAKGGALGQEAQTIATQLEAQISDLTSELGNVYMGGNSPTDHSLGLAAQNLSANWSYPQLMSAVALARKNLQIRLNSIKSTGVIGVSDVNPYAGVRSGTAGADYVYDPVTKTLKKVGG